MISFDLSETQKILQNKFHKISETKLRPQLIPIEQKPPGQIDPVHLNVLAEENLNALFIPKKYGGKGLDNITLALLIEEIAWGSVDLSSIYLANLHAIKTLLIAGSEKQKNKFLPIMMNPKKGIASFCPTEPRGGSDSSFFETTARQEKGFYVLNGVKNPVINAGDASFYIVWANMENDQSRSGINIFIVTRDADGLSCGPYYDKTGYRGVPIRSVTFKDVRVSRDCLIGTMGSGYLTLMQVVDWGRAMVGATCVAIARAAIETAVEHAKKRIIKKRPIMSNQGVSFLLADLSTQLEAARLLVWKACKLIDAGSDYTSASSMAKLFAVELAVRATSDGLLILGQECISRFSLMNKLHNDALLTRITEGTSQIQKAIIASQL
jgi:alkylation response protein AidB-like acyl-CoA dehydrogenase